MIIAAAPVIAAQRSVELVPWLGVRGGAKLDADTVPAPPAEAPASASLGFGVLVPVRPDGWFETFIDHQQLSFPGFDFAVDYLQFGGGYQPGEGKVRPFVAASLGLTRYGSSPGDVENTIGVSGSLAGGFSVPMGQRLSFRFEVRGYATITDAAVSVACGPGCFVQFGGDGWYQLAARAGLAIRL
jgi:hypothetical protein